MRLMRILLTGLVAAFALVAGLFIAAIGVIALVIGRLFGRTGGVRVRTQFAGPGQRPPPRPSVHNHGDVIDVTATEVPANPLPR